MLAALLSGACHPSGTEASKTPTQAAIAGYGNLKFGMSLTEALSLTGSSHFNPAGILGCAKDLAIRGCTLHPDTNLDAYATIDGIPYGLGLAFNRFDKLTDITLQYERETIEDEEQRLTPAECRTIADRSIDWLSKRFGPMTSAELKGDHLKERRTPAGARYWSADGDGGFMSSGKVEKAGHRQISFMGYYLLPGEDVDCSISVTFGDDPKIERWRLSAEEQRIIDDAARQAR